MSTRALRHSARRAAVLASVAILLGATSPHRASAAPDSAAVSSYAARCASCHGVDGSGDTVVGRSAGIPDLRSSQVQSESDDKLADVIAKGAGPMPPFAATLSKDDITGLVAYVRTLPAH